MNEHPPVQPPTSPQGPAANPEPPEPGSPTTARVAGLAVFLLIAVVAVLQQLAGAAPEPTPAPASITGPSSDFELTAKVLTKIAWREKATWAPQVVRQLDKMARTPEDRLRTFIVEAELKGPEGLRQRLESLAPEIPAGSPLADHAATVGRIYIDRERPPPEQVESLVSAHGWFGRLAATHLDEPGSPARQRLVGGGGVLIAIMLTIMVVGGAALVTGAVLLLVAFITWASGQRFTRFVPRPPGGSVLIETVAIFVAGFLVLKLATGVVAVVFTDPEVATWFALVCQWLLLLCLFWPVVRGVPLHRAMHDLGLHRGRGVFAEVGSGIVGYIACLPLLACGVLISMALLALYAFGRAAAGLPEPPTPRNEVIEIVAESRGTWVIVLLFLLASLWAPLAEETIFRGALYGHLRRRWSVIPAAIVTALAFGLMHGYMILLLGPVIALGVGFCLMREWRGSLIGPITAHCMHNATVLTLLLVVFRIVGD